MTSYLARTPTPRVQQVWGIHILALHYDCATGNGKERDARLASAQLGCAGLRTLQCVVNVADVVVSRLEPDLKNVDNQVYNLAIWGLSK